MQRLTAIVFLCVVLLLFSSLKKALPDQRPNILLIVADDLGYSDLASYGNAYIQTPNIDSLGIRGIRCTEAYVSAPICAPSRMGLFTGRNQDRYGCEYMPYDHFDPEFMRNLRRNYFSLRRTNPGAKALHPDILLNPDNHETELPAGELTLGELCKRAGYVTGLIGKWNLGSATANQPGNRGFDYSYYFSGALTRYTDDLTDTARYINYHLPWSFSELVAWAPRYGSSAIREGDREIKDTGYLTQSFADKASAFIDRAGAAPFFLTLTFNAPHDPFQVPKTYFDRIGGVTDSTKRVYYGMIEALDDAVGQVVQSLQRRGLLDNTIIFFLSDNGGATYTRATDNAPLRGGKCTHFDGGLRVPFLVQYPGQLPAGRVFDQPLSSLDLFTTIAGLTGTSVPGDRVYDGVDLLPYLNGKQAAAPHELFYWRSGYSKAIRKGNWKLYLNEKDKRSFLFDLSNDPGELHDLSASQPEKVKELSAELKTWEKTQTVRPAWPSAADVDIEVEGQSYSFPT